MAGPKFVNSAIEASQFPSDLGYYSVEIDASSRLLYKHERIPRLGGGLDSTHLQTAVRDNGAEVDIRRPTPYIQHDR